MSYYKTHSKVKTIGIVIALILVAIISFFFISNLAKSPDTYTHLVESIDAKESTVMKMTAASVTLSTAITAIPGDVANPVAENLADLSGYFVVILSTLYFEKFFLIITGLVTFKFVIPIFLLIMAASLFIDSEKRQVITKVCVKILLVSMALWALVPASVMLSNFIEESYEDYIYSTIEEAENTADSINDASEGSKDQQTFLDKVKDKFNLVSNGVVGITAKLDGILTGFIRGISAMIVTSCVIPIITLWISLWVIRMLTGVSIKVPSGRGFSRRVKGFNKKVSNTIKGPLE